MYSKNSQRTAYLFLILLRGEHSSKMK